MALFLMAGCATQSTVAPNVAAKAQEISSPKVASRPCQSTRPVPAGDSRQQINVDGRWRSYARHIPPTFTGTSRVALVVDLHGAGQNGAGQGEVSDFASVADEHGFVVVEPDAINGAWSLPKPGAQSSDTRFIAALIRELRRTLCVDRRRVYASGMSMGSGMVFLEACLPNSPFAAYGGVSATLFGPGCDEARGAPIIYFHGTADPLVAYRGGSLHLGSYSTDVPSVPATMARWAQHNGCSLRDRQITADLTVTKWRHCKGHPVEFYRVANGGHTWPGMDPGTAAAVARELGRTTQTVKATEEMWRFFTEHRLS